MQMQVSNFRDDLVLQQRGEPQPGPSLQQSPELEPDPSFNASVWSEQTATGWAQSAIPRLEEQDDIELYLTTFEHLAVAYQWPEADWAVRLVPQLTRRIHAAYVDLAIEDMRLQEGERSYFNIE